MTSELLRYRGRIDAKVDRISVQVTAIHQELERIRRRMVLVAATVLVAVAMIGIWASLHH